MLTSVGTGGFFRSAATRFAHSSDGKSTFANNAYLLKDGDSDIFVSHALCVTNGEDGTDVKVLTDRVHCGACSEAYDAWLFEDTLQQLVRTAEMVLKCCPSKCCSYRSCMSIFVCSCHMITDTCQFSVCCFIYMCMCIVCCVYEVYDLP